MLTHSLRRWPVIATALSDCTVVSDCCIMQVTLYIPAPETQIKPNADEMLGHRLRPGPTLFQPKPFKLLTTNIIMNIFFLNTC